MKKIVSITLAFIMIFISTVSFAEIQPKLENHWAKTSIKKDFVAYYFPYLAKDGFLKFNPNEEINYSDFLLSLSSLYKDYGIKINMSTFGYNENLTRESVLSILDNEVFRSYIETYKSENIYFEDISNMSENNVDLLRSLVKLNVISGVSKTSFAPEKKLTQAEAIVMLQRIKSVFDKMGLIGYKVIETVQAYTGDDMILVEELEDKIFVTINKSFSTPGHGMTVDKITKINDGYKISLNISTPNPDVILPQVITYINLKLEIGKNLLTENLPYNFIVEESNNKMQ